MKMKQIVFYYNLSITIYLCIQILGIFKGIWKSKQQMLVTSTS